MKTYTKFMKEVLTEETPTNHMGGNFADPQVGDAGNIAGYSPVLGGGKRKRNKFAGADVFKVTSEDYSKSVNGRMKWQRWGKTMNMEDFGNQEIRTYCHKNPGKAIVIQDENSGVMSYLIPPANSDAGKIATLGGPVDEAKPSGRRYETGDDHPGIDPDLELDEKKKEPKKEPMFFSKRTKKMTPEEKQAAIDFYTRQGKPLGRRVASQAFNLGDKNPPIEIVYDHVEVDESLGVPGNPSRPMTPADMLRMVERRSKIIKKLQDKTAAAYVIQKQELEPGPKTAKYNKLADRLDQLRNKRNKGDNK